MVLNEKVEYRVSAADSLCVSRTNCLYVIARVPYRAKPIGHTNRLNGSESDVIWAALFEHT